MMRRDCEWLFDAVVWTGVKNSLWAFLNPFEGGCAQLFAYHHVLFDLMMTEKEYSTMMGD